MEPEDAEHPEAQDSEAGAHPAQCPDPPEPPDDASDAEDEDEQSDAGLAMAACELRAGAPAAAVSHRAGRLVLLLAGAVSLAVHAAVVAAAMLIVARLHLSMAHLRPDSDEGAVLTAFSPGTSEMTTWTRPAVPDPPAVATPSDPVPAISAAEAGAEQDPGPPVLAVVPLQAEPEDVPAPRSSPLADSTWDIAPTFPGKRPPPLASDAATDSGKSLAELSAVVPAPSAGSAPPTGAGKEVRHVVAHAFNPARIVGRAAGGRSGPRDGFDERGLPKPEYPAESRRRGEQGLVELDIEVLANGSAGAVRVIRDPGYPRLVQAAVAAARRGQFEPASLNGKLIPGHVPIPYRFILD